MSDPVDSVQEPTAEQLAAIDHVLARPEIWDDPPADLESSVIAAIAAARDDAGVGRPVSRLRARSAMPWWLTAAAAVTIVVTAIAILGRGDERAEAVEFAMTGTDAAPGASASVRLSATPAGLKILLDADGLPGAPEGFFYEAWVSDGTTRVSAGTFHLRGGDAEIELWAGVVEPSFTTLSVTLEPLDTDTDTSGDVRLVGQYVLGD